MNGGAATVAGEAAVTPAAGGPVGGANGGLNHPYAGSGADVIRLSESDEHLLSLNVRLFGERADSCLLEKRFRVDDLDDARAASGAFASSPDGPAGVHPRSVLGNSCVQIVNGEMLYFDRDRNVTFKMIRSNGMAEHFRRKTIPVEVQVPRNRQQSAAATTPSASKFKAKQIASAGDTAKKALVGGGSDAAKKRMRDGVGDQQQQPPNKRTKPAKWTLDEDTALLAGLWHLRTKFDEILKKFDPIFSANKRTVPGLASRYQSNKNSFGAWFQKLKEKFQTTKKDPSFDEMRSIVKDTQVNKAAANFTTASLTSKGLSKTMQTAAVPSAIPAVPSAAAPAVGAKTATVPSPGVRQQQQTPITVAKPSPPAQAKAPVPAVNASIPASIPRKDSGGAGASKGPSSAVSGAPHARAGGPETAARLKPESDDEDEGAGPEKLNNLNKLPWTSLEETTLLSAGKEYGLTLARMPEIMKDPRYGSILSRRSAKAIYKKLQKLTKARENMQGGNGNVSKPPGTVPPIGAGGAQMRVPGSAPARGKMAAAAVQRRQPQPTIGAIGAQVQAKNLQNVLDVSRADARGNPAVSASAGVPVRPTPPVPPAAAVAAAAAKSTQPAKPSPPPTAAAQASTVASVGPTVLSAPAAKTAETGTGAQLRAATVTAAVKPSQTPAASAMTAVAVQPPPPPPPSGAAAARTTDPAQMSAAPAPAAKGTDSVQAPPPTASAATIVEAVQPPPPQAPAAAPHGAPTPAPAGVPMEPAVALQPHDKSDTTPRADP